MTVCNMRFRYAVGDDGVVLKYANALSSDAAATLDSAVSASSPEVEAAVVSIGSAGTWSVVSVPSTASTSTLYGVHVLPGVESADVVVVGSAGLLMELERGSQSWTVKDTPTTKDLLSVHTSSPVHGYTAVGRDATILYVLVGGAPRGGGGRVMTSDSLCVCCIVATTGIGTTPASGCRRFRRTSSSMLASELQALTCTRCSGRSRACSMPERPPLLVALAQRPLNCVRTTGTMRRCGCIVGVGAAFT